LPKAEFNPKMFTIYEISRILRIKYHKALRLVNFLIEHECAEKVNHDGDKRKRRYGLV
jgi:hypothetical protein